MFLFNWMKSRSIRFRILSLIGVLILPICILIQAYIIPTFEQKFLHNKQESTRFAVEIALGSIQKFYDEFKAGKISEEDAKKWSLETIKNMRYNEKEYFWIHSEDNKMVMHPIKPELIGKDLSEMKDPNGKFLFSEMTALVKKENKGFIDYYWSKPGSDAPVPKISFIQGFKSWGWIIGTGVYVDDVASEVRTLTARIWTVLSIVLFVVLTLVLLFSNYLTKKLMMISSRVYEGSQIFKTTSHNITNSSEDLSKRTYSSAAALQQTSASLEEISNMIKKSADNSDTLLKISENSRRNVHQGKEALEKMMSTMTLINDSNRQIATQVEASNNEISDIVKLIRGRM